MCGCQGQSSCGSSGCGGSDSKGCSCSCHKMGSGCQSASACGSHQGCDYATKFLELADQAWMEVLKEKIKEHIRSDAKNMDELAHLISEANHERWHRKMESKQKSGCYEEKLKDFFMSSCQSQCQKK